MDVNYKEVDYFTYCQTCKHIKKKGAEDPCNECLTIFFREGTTVPEKYEEDETTRVKNNAYNETDNN